MNKITGSISVEHVHDILESMYECRQEMVPCFIGAPGIGKTASLYQFAKEKGVKVVTFILSNTVPSEVSGIRMPDQESKRMEVFDDMRMASLEDGDILFFDEFLEASPMLWSACLTLIQDRVMASGRKLPDVFIVAASSPVASAGIIPASVRNRFQFILTRFDFDYWSRWFENKYGIQPSTEWMNTIEEDSDQYNILTPREITKLYEWMLSDKHREIQRLVIEESFGVRTWRLLYKMIPKSDAREQIKSTLGKLNLEIPESLEAMSYQDILEALSRHPQWDEIQEALAQVEYEEEESV